MGLDDKGTQFLLAARRLGVTFARTATIGRQRLYLPEGLLRRHLAAFGLTGTDAAARREVDEADGFSEPFLRLLGAQRIASIDASPYEGASDVVDLNAPLPDRLREAFTAVVDAGTLEHVFDFPTAIKNCMQMVARGGHFLSITIANNATGHGFYQFSPELFFRALSPSNGFVVRRLLVTETSSGRWYAVTDPARLRARVQLRTFRPTYLCVLARRVAIKPLFETPQQQSDYVARWETEAGAARRHDAASELHPIERYAPPAVARAVKTCYHMLQAAVLPFDRRAFRRVELTRLPVDDPPTPS